MKRCNQPDHVFNGKRCVTCFKDSQRRWYMKNKEIILAEMHENKVALALYAKRRYEELKREVIEHYGGSCFCCGEKLIAFLTIDHPNNDGSKHRAELGNKGRGGNFYRWLKDNNFPEGFQVSCFNCNCGRQINGGVCPHIAERKCNLGHSFEQSGPGDAIINMKRPDGHAHLDQKYDKGMRSPWLGTIAHQDAGLVSPEVSDQSGSGHMDSGYSGVGGTNA